MPKKPEYMKAPYKKHETEERETFSYRRDPESKKRYQTYKWQKYRHGLKVAQRNEDIMHVHKFYVEHEDISFQDYQEWLAGSEPLCVHCKAEGKLSGAQVADHIQRIQAGGEMYDRENIQWLCHYHHNIKSGKEAHDDQAKR